MSALLDEYPLDDEDDYDELPEIPRTSEDCGRSSSFDNHCLDHLLPLVALAWCLLLGGSAAAMLWSIANLFVP